MNDAVIAKYSCNLSSAVKPQFAPSIKGHPYVVKRLPSGSECVVKKYIQVTALKKSTPSVQPCKPIKSKKSLVTFKFLSTQQTHTQLGNITIIFGFFFIPEINGQNVERGQKTFFTRSPSEKGFPFLESK